MRRLLEQLLPFIILGIGLVAFAFGMILFAYLFIFGAMIGLILFIVAWVKNKFFAPKSAVTQPKKKPGRTIDSDDWDRL